MGKYVNDLVMDAAFDYIRARVTQLTVCSTQPTSYAEATSTYKLADGPMTSTEITLADGDTSGRKMTVASQQNLTVDASGTAQHVALVGSSGSTLLLVTTVTSQALTSGNTVNVPTFDNEIGDAS